ncbi:uncharacterized protein ATNIH1004_003357 [Aspergillus tanneri]|uniref:Uncharacterized protein n=1 Tax=Aspergillus tanneri TaxID=1220188 RepID=A0A5M9N142_9EURO|nr:uncharacterized protein ATNIH1004_003357 [Aspergillus tanneri]KAA8650669.1 hypothetical protein ATNIH1004_003357 [Aspergillus tanneri]
MYDPFAFTFIPSTTNGNANDNQLVRRFQSDTLLAALLNTKELTKDIDLSLLGMDEEDLKAATEDAATKDATPKGNASKDKVPAKGTAT